MDPVRNEQFGKHLEDLIATLKYSTDEFVPLLYLNIRSLIGKYHELEFRIGECVRLPIVCMTETWITGFQNTVFPCWSNFSIYRLDRVGKKGGGCAILIPLEFPSHQVDEPICVEMYEILVVEVMLTGKVRIILVYRPPNAPNPVDAELALCDKLQSLIVPGEATIILGDFNYPEIDWETKLTIGSLHNQVEFLNFVLVNGFDQLVDQPTRAQNTLDLILSNEDNLVQNVEIEASPSSWM